MSDTLTAWLVALTLVMITAHIIQIRYRLRKVEDIFKAEGKI